MLTFELLRTSENYTFKNRQGEEIESREHTKHVRFVPTPLWFL